MFSPFCSDLFKYLLGASWTLLKSFSHRVFYLYFMFVHIVSHAHNSYKVVLYRDMMFYYILGFYCKVLCTKATLQGLTLTFQGKESVGLLTCEI